MNPQEQFGPIATPAHNTPTYTRLVSNYKSEYNIGLKARGVVKGKFCSDWAATFGRPCRKHAAAGATDAYPCSYVGHPMDVVALRRAYRKCKAPDTDWNEHAQTRIVGDQPGVPRTTY